MKKYYSKKNEKQPQDRILRSELKSKSMFWILVTIAILLIYMSVYFNDWMQNLFLGLGTGAATSAMVSLVFSFNDNQAKVRERLENRIKFMKEFKLVYHNILFSIDFDNRIRDRIDLEEYIKSQHRWYHDYYKRMLANNENEKETLLRTNQLQQFLQYNYPNVQQYFEYDFTWESSEFTERQKSELLKFYIGLKKVQFYLEEENFKNAFLEFASFIECFKRLPSEFIELNNFLLLYFSHDENGILISDREKFEEKEPFFRYAREFNEIRYTNYVKKYAKQVDVNQKNIDEI